MNTATNSSLIKKSSTDASPRVLTVEERTTSLSGIVVIGASLGGTRAISYLLTGLPRRFPLPVALVLHRATDSDASLREVLQRHSTLPVFEAEDKMQAVAGHVYLAPANYHLLVGEGCFSLSTEAPVVCARPSIDILFDSASAACGSDTLGILLTGASNDGAFGASKICEGGGVMLVQDPKTAECPIMPQAIEIHSTRQGEL